VCRESQIQEMDQEQPQTQDTQQAQDTFKYKETVLKFIMKLSLVLLIIWFVFNYVFGIRQVSGLTMYPSLEDGDLVVYYRLEDNYQIGDVVTFKIDDYTFYARIVAQGGDVVEVTDDGELIVNGNVQQEDVFYPTEPQAGDVTYPCTVEDGSYFVLCDYRTVGLDSRTYGTISEDDFDGKLISVFRRREI
jgi:signal peptidase I